MMVIGSTIQNKDLAAHPVSVDALVMHLVQRGAEIWLRLPDEITGTACRCDGWALPRSQRLFHNGMLFAHFICEELR